VTSRRLDEFEKEDCVSVHFETVNSARGSIPHTEKMSKTATTDIPSVPFGAHGVVSGELLQWHKVTIGFSGPPASETGMTVPGIHRAPTPFADYRLDVTFFHEESRATYVVPGYYAADGNAANTHSVSGTVWIVHFLPEKTGRYTWEAVFLEGPAVAMHGRGNPGQFFDGSNGSFDVKPSNKHDNRDFRSSKGRVIASEGRSFRFSNGETLNRVESQSPLNLLSFDDFDETYSHRGPSTTFASHVADYNPEEGRTFANGKGVGLLGAIAYMAQKGVNTLTATTLQGDEVYPFKRTSNLLQYDISKLAQWGATYTYAN